jgi:hypothetical protein
MSRMMADGAKASPTLLSIGFLQHTSNVSSTPSAESTNPFEGTYRASGRNSMSTRSARFSYSEASRRYSCTFGSCNAFDIIFSPARLDERTRIEPGNAARAITRSDLALRCNCAMMVNSHRDSENRWTPLLGRIRCPSRWLVPAFGNSFYSSQLRAQRSRKERASKCLRPPATRTSSSNLGTFGALTNLTQNKYLLRRATISYGRGSYRHAWLGLRQPRKSIHGLCRSRKKLGGPQARV